ncbi:hypothetical protein BN133_1092 [Cronobacter dublinensis 582]|nr:hypothetical protein BN133_1092 [Cronobacter dublinensis 582]
MATIRSVIKVSSSLIFKSRAPFSHSSAALTAICSNYP